MNDSLQPAASSPDGAGAPSEHELSPAEIDARHAKQLVERAFSQLERGERGAAELAVRQAIHLAPGVATIHSLAGLLALLNGDKETARIGYENAVTDFSKASPERERLIALRMAQANDSVVEAASFVPSLPAEIARLRAMLQATPPQSFLPDPQNPTHAQPRVAYKSETPPAIAAPSPAIAPPAENSAAARPAFASRLEQRKRASAWAMGIAAVSAAIVAFFVVRSLVAPQPMPQDGSTPIANQAVVDNAAPADNAATGSAAQNSATETPASGAGGSTPNAETSASNASGAESTPSPTTPAPSATVTVKPMPPTNTPPPRPAPTPASNPKPAPPIIPGLPRPAPRPTPTPTPAPTTPHDPNFPPMPPPKITLPSAGGEKTEFPRVLPDND